MKKLAFYTLSLILIIAGCTKDPVDTSDDTRLVEKSTDLIVSPDFSYLMTKKVQVNITVQTADVLLSNVRVNLLKEPAAEGEDLNEQDHYIRSVASDENGKISTIVELPSYIDTIYFSTDYLGIESSGKIPVYGDVATYSFGGEPEFKSDKIEFGLQKYKGGISFTSMGTWDYLGVPYYLDGRDQISSDFLDDVNASLPEGSPLPESHPQYLADGNQSNILLKEEADIWVSFVHEGAGYKNVLGYYAYNKDNPPVVAGDIDEHIIIFPNVSYQYSGGGLRTGDRVYLGRFTPGTVIGWFLVADGFYWGDVSTGRNVYYSDPAFNPESNEDVRQHNVLLLDEEREILLLGFEDLDREGHTDDDFNDAVFYATVTPFTAVDPDGLNPVDTPEDTDGDGVTDTFDDYPDDPEKAYNNYYPAEGQYGSLSFEDLWPAKGDYDFNDMVLDYQFNQISNAGNEVVEVKASIILKAAGASFSNGFAFEMDLAPDAIEQLTGSLLEENIVSLNANGTESGVDKAVIHVFDNAKNILRYPGSGIGINTSPGAPYVDPVEVELTIELSEPVQIDEMPSPPYNPFIYIAGNRGREVHLPDYMPTALADATLFGVNDDDTNPNTGKYYKSKLNLPWALNLPESFDYPEEKVDIVQAYHKFRYWVESGGNEYPDWYKDLLSYRDEELIYQVQ